MNPTKTKPTIKMMSVTSNEPSKLTSPYISTTKSSSGSPI